MKAYTSLTIVVVTLFAAVAAVFGQTGNGAAANGFSESPGYEPRVFPDNYSKKKKKKKEGKDEDKVAEAVTGSTAGPAAVELRVSVFDGKGNLARGLKASDFSVFLDDEEQRVDSVEMRSEPLNVVLMLDASPSTSYKLSEIQQYADAIVERLRPDDKVMAVAFSLEMKVLADWTTDKAAIRKAIEKFVKRQGEDGTSLFDSVSQLFTDRLPGVAGPKAVIVFSDGMDTTSRKATYESSLLAAERAGVPIYPVYFDTMVDIKARMKNFPASLLVNPASGAALRLPSGRSILSPEEEAQLGRWYLNDLVNLSGGRAIVYEKVKAGTSLISTTIPAELHGQYVVTFTPAKGTTGRRRQKIRVQINRPNLLVAARGSFISNTDDRP